MRVPHLHTQIDTYTHAYIHTHTDGKTAGAESEIPGTDCSPQELVSRAPELTCKKLLSAPITSLEFRFEES